MSQQTSPKATWKAHDEEGALSGHERDTLPDTVYAFPKQRKEPLTSASHVKTALARFNQVEGVSDADRAQAFENIRAAARHFGVEMRETSWRDLMDGHAKGS